MSGKLDLRIAKTYKLLSAGLFTLLDKKTFEAISVSHICQIAMVSRATFYTHFEDKYHLLQYAFYSLKKELTTKETFCPSQNPSTIVSIIEHIHNHKNMYKNLFSSGPNSQHYTLINQMIADDIKISIKNAKEKDTKFPLPTEMIAQFITGGILNVIQWWVLNDFPIHKDEIIQYMLDNTLHPTALTQNFA